MIVNNKRQQDKKIGNEPRVSTHSLFVYMKKEKKYLQDPLRYWAKWIIFPSISSVLRFRHTIKCLESPCPKHDARDETSKIDYFKKNAKMKTVKTTKANYAIRSHSNPVWITTKRCSGFGYHSWRSSPEIWSCQSHCCRNRRRSHCCRRSHRRHLVFWNLW